ncbi:MAG: DUF748 domain-containing protein [Desulfocapsaceae bacterium]|nr:DUF748 domain-containing protein [Desulfocapsaceae bacterium]
MSNHFGTISINPEPDAPTPRPRRQKTGRRSKPKKSTPNQTQSRRWLLLFIIPAFLMTAYGAVGFFFGPSLLTGYLSDSLRQSTNLGLTTGEARFNPFTLQLQLDKVATTDNSQGLAPETTLLKINHLLIDLNLMALLRNGLACNRLEIQGLTLSIIRYPDKSYNLPNLVSEHNLETEEGHLSLSRLPVLFSLNNITISDSTILFDDRLTGKKHSVEQIKLDLPTLSNYSFAAKEYIRPHFSAVINGSPLELSGEAALPGENGQNGLKTNLACNVQDLDLPLYFAYLPKSLPLILSQGKGNGKIQIAFIPEGKKGGHLSLSFRLTTTDIVLGNTEQTLSLTAPTMEIEGNLQPLAGGLHIRNMHILQPHLSANQAHFAQNVSRLFPTPADSQKETGQGNHLDIDSLIVEDGVLQLDDKMQKDSVPPPWKSIELNVKNFQLVPDQTRDKGTFTLSSTQEKTNASMTWQGSFNSRGIPGGTLQLNNIKAATLLSFIASGQAAEASGSANLSGHFSFDPTARNSAMASLIDASTEFHDLKLLDRNKVWLSAKTAQIKDTKFKGEDLDLGTITIKDGNLTLHQNKLPQFLQDLDDKNKAILIQGLAFSGNAILHPQKEKAPALQLTELTIKASNLTARSNSQNNFEFTTRINQTGMLKAQGLATLSPLRTSLSLVFSAINSEQVAPWLPDTPLFQQSRATINGQGTYRYPESSFSGKVQLDSALIRDSEKSSGLAVDNAELNDLTIKVRPLHIGLNELILHGPKLTWQQDPGSAEPYAQVGSFLQNLFFQPQDKNGQQQESNISTQLAIQKISFINGAINHVDQRLNPPWSSEINVIKGQINNLQENAGSGADFHLSGLINSIPFTLSGSADFLDSQDHCTTELELKGFPLLLLSAQITPLLDLNPQSGSFDLALNFKRQNGEEQGEATLLFSKLRPDSAQSDTALPLALLTDSQDQVKLVIPLARNSAQALFNQTIATFKTLMVKAEVAPLLLAGAEFTDLQEKQHILFSPGQSELDINSTSEAQGWQNDTGARYGVSAQKTLQGFGALLAAHPRLGLTLTGMADPIHDRNAILRKLEAKEEKRVSLINEQRLQEWRNRQKQRPQPAPPIPVQGKIIEQDIPKEEPAPTPLAPEPITVSDTVLQDLAQERALQVYDFCTTDLGIASKRITLQKQALMQAPEMPSHQVQIGFKYVEPAGQ